MCYLLTQYTKKRQVMITQWHNTGRVYKWSLYFFESNIGKKQDAISLLVEELDLVESLYSLNSNKRRWQLRKFRWLQRRWWRIPTIVDLERMNKQGCILKQVAEDGGTSTKTSGKVSFESQIKIHYLIPKKMWNRKFPCRIESDKKCHAQITSQPKISKLRFWPMSCLLADFVNWGTNSEFTFSETGCKESSPWPSFWFGWKHALTFRASYSEQFSYRLFPNYSDLTSVFFLCSDFLFWTLNHKALLHKYKAPLINLTGDNIERCFPCIFLMLDQSDHACIFEEPKSNFFCKSNSN